MAPFFMLDSFMMYLRSERRFSEHTVIAYRKDLEQFLEFTGVSNEEGIKEVSSRIIRAWVVDLMETDYMGVSVNRKLSTLRTFFRWLKKEGHVVDNPMRLVKGPKSQKRLPAFVQKKSLQQEQMQPVFPNDAEGLRDRLMIEMFYQTGMRASELINLKDGDVRESAVKVLGKRNKERHIPISDSLNELIGIYRNVRPGGSEYFFRRENGEPLYPKFVYRKVNHYLTVLSDVSKRSPHVLRHTFATHMLNNGAGLEVLKELLGHANLSATQVYTHNSFAQLSTIYAKAHPRGTGN